MSCKIFFRRHAKVDLVSSLSIQQSLNYG